MKQLFNYLNYPAIPNKYGTYEYMRRINDKLFIITIIPNKLVFYRYQLSCYDMSNQFNPKHLGTITLFDIDQFTNLVIDRFEQEYKHAA